MTVRQPIGRQVGIRLLLALLVAGVAAILAAYWFHGTANERAEASRLRVARDHYAATLAELDRDLGRAAYNFRVRLEFLRILDDPSTRQSRMDAYLSAQGGSAEFPRLLVLDAAGRNLIEFAHGAPLPPGSFRAGENSTWAFDADRERLYLVFRQFIWLGDRNGVLLLYKPLDHALMTRLAYPETSVSLIWRDRAVATSIGADGLPGAQALLAELGPAGDPRLLHWRNGNPDSPGLLIQTERRNVFAAGEMAVPLLIGILGFAAIAWVVLGAWLVRTIQRVLAMEQAQNLFLARQTVDTDIALALSAGANHRDDEIASLAVSLHRLMDGTVAHQRELRLRLAQLRENDEIHRSIIDTSLDGYWQADRDGRLLAVNPSYVRLSGYSREALLRMRWKDLEAPDERQKLPTRLEALFAGGHARFETRHRRRDGSEWAVEISASFRNQGDGQVFCFLRDISERKRVEAELRIAAATFEAQEGIMVTDAQGTILRVNRTFTEITGYSAGEAVGQTPAMLNSGRQDKAFYAGMWKAIAERGAWQGEVWNRRKDGAVYPEWLTITAVKTADGRNSHYVGIFADITQRKLAEDEIRRLAFYDPLTRLPNRRLLLDRLQQAVTASSRHRRHGALMLLDMDDFKTLNDTLGHDIGDQFLVQVAERIAGCVRDGDTVARLGGDEFVIILEDLDREALAPMQAENVAVKIQNALAGPYALRLTLAGVEADTRSHHCTSSIGIAMFLGHETTVDELLKQADTAMYQAKAAGRNTLRFFGPDMQAAVTARAALDADLRRALRRQQFVLHFQPQVDARGRLTGAEALLRWNHPQRGMVSPLDFIPLAEETGLIEPLGAWVLKAASSQLAAWAGDARTAELTLAVNVSARQFRHRNFVGEVLAAITAAGANPRLLKLELTESMLVSDIAEVVAKMEALKAYGIGFSLDDFGTGYSSLSYIKTLPLDQLKIDQSFVRDILADPDDAAIARAIVALAASLELDVIAEGVENEHQRDFLATCGCIAFQGYYFSPPLPLDEFEAYARGLPLTLPES